MNMIFHKTRALVFFVLAILMTACLEKQFEPEEKETPPVTGGTENGIPDDFDFSTKSTHTLTVKVADEYDGKRYYTVEVFKSNPISNPSAELICGAKTNKNLPFEVEIVIPKIQKQIFVRLTDPKGFKFVTELEIKEGNLLLDYNAADTKTKSAVLRSSSDYDKANPVDYDSFFKAGLKDAEEITSKNAKLEVGRSYRISDKNFKGSISFPRGQFVLYVDEGCSMTLNGQDKAQELSDGAEIYILKEASIDANSAEITIGKSAKVFNAGTLDLKSILLQGANSILYNHPGSKIELSSLILDGGGVFNHCIINVSDLVFSGTGSNLCMRSNSSMNVNSVDFQEGHSGCSIYFNARALLHVNKFHKATNSYLSIYGEVGIGSFEDYPLLQIEGEMKCSYILLYQQLLLDTKGRMDGLVKQSNNVYQVDGDTPTNMQGGCYLIQNNPDDKDFTEDSKDPVYTPQDKETLAYVYMFEDNWPGIGDYDMNDVVINVGVMNTTLGSNATTAHITGEVIAVGAKKDLYVFAQIDGTDKVVNLLGEEVHSFMGKPSNETINTYKSDTKPKSFNYDLDVKGMEGLVNANNLNVFIVWGDPSGSKRNEVHVVGFYGTKQAATSVNSTNDYKYISDDESNNLMWGLMIPKDTYSTYPKEGTPIKDAYPGFLDWAKSGGKSAVDWFTSGLEDKVFHPK